MKQYSRGTYILTIRTKFITFAILLLISLISLRCDRIIAVNVEGGDPPIFNLHGDENWVRELTIYHITKEDAETKTGQGTKIDKPLLYKDFMDIPEKMMWSISGKCLVRRPFVYGVVPDGMEEKVPAKPLIEGEYYFVYIFRRSGPCPGMLFTIRDGKAVELWK